MSPNPGEIPFLLVKESTAISRDIIITSTPAQAYSGESPRRRVVLHSQDGHSPLEGHGKWEKNRAEMWAGVVCPWDTFKKPGSFCISMTSVSRRKREHTHKEIQKRLFNVHMLDEINWCKQRRSCLYCLYSAVSYPLGIRISMNQYVSCLLTFIQIVSYSVTSPFSRSGFGWNDYWAAIRDLFSFFFCCF